MPQPNSQAVQTRRLFKLHHHRHHHHHHHHHHRRPFGSSHLDHILSFDRVFSSFFMGSHGFAHLYPCASCNQNSIVTLGYVESGRESYNECCLRCYRYSKQRVLKALLSGAQCRAVRDVAARPRLLDHLTLFMYWPYLRPRKLHYLQYVLLSRQGSPFRLFTYYTNGIAGNCSRTMDILDVILQLVA